MSSKGTCRTLNLLSCSTLPCRNVSMSFKSTCNVKAAFDIRHFKCKGSLAYNMLAQQHDVVRPDAARTRTLELQLLGHVLQHNPTKTYMCTAIGIEVIASVLFALTLSRFAMDAAQWQSNPMSPKLRSIAELLCKRSLRCCASATWTNEHQSSSPPTCVPC